MLRVFDILLEFNGWPMNEFRLTMSNCIRLLLVIVVHGQKMGENMYNVM